MDLISMAQILWRRKILTIPLLILTALGAFYVVKVKPPTYQAQSSILMVPPSPPTAAQIAADPALGKINPNNPYMNYGDYSVVADTLIDTVTDSANQRALATQGADPRYQLALSTDYGNPPIIDITGVGHSPQIAMRSAELVTQAAEADLYKLQANAGVNRLYMIRATQLITPTAATSSMSGKLRTLIAVLAAGMLLLFVAVSLAEAVEKRRNGYAGKDAATARPREQQRSRVRFQSRYRNRPGLVPSRGPVSKGMASAPSEAVSAGASGAAARSAPLAPHDATIRRRTERRPDRPSVAAPLPRPRPLDQLPMGPTGDSGSHGR